MEAVQNIEELFKYVLTASSLATIVIMILLAIKFILKNKVSAKWHYYIWLMPLVIMTGALNPAVDKYLSPGTITSVNQPQNQYHMVDTTDGTKKAYFTENYSKSQQKVVTLDAEIEAQQHYKNNYPEKGNYKKRTFYDQEISFKIISLVWALGVVLCLLRIMLVKLFVSRMVSNTRLSIQTEVKADILNLLKILAQQMGVKRNISIVLQTYLKAPCILGVFRPRIVLNKEILNCANKENLSHILYHEIAHYKCGHLVINFLANVIYALHWCNPVAWYVIKKMRLDCELACDEAVLEYLGPKEKTNYGETVISVLAHISSQQKRITVLGMTGTNLKDIERRVETIQRFGKNRLLSSLSVTLLAAVVSLMVIGCSAGPITSINALIGNKHTNQSVERGTIYDRNGLILAQDKDDKRVYPFGSLANDTIGYLTQDGNGADGVERIMDEYLRQGRGNNITLTMDIKMQEIVEKQLTQAIGELGDNIKGGSVIVINPQNGDVLALVTKTMAENKATINEHAKKYSALSYLYQPGSSFKGITASMAMDAGIVTPETIVSDTAYLVDDQRLNCWFHSTHGEETFKEAIINGCHPIFAKLANDLGQTKFNAYIENWGFNEPTDLDLGHESSGVFQSNPTNLNLAMNGIGQGFSITPLHMARGYSALANGGYLVTPRFFTKVTDFEGNIVKEFTTPNVKRVVTNETSATMKQILKECVLDGVWNEAQIKNYSIAGMGGTSTVPQSNAYVSSFVGFAPADKPSICLVTVLEGSPGASLHANHTAATIAGKLTEGILDYYQQLN